MSGSVCVCVFKFALTRTCLADHPSLSLNPQCQTDAAVFYQLVSLSILNPKSNLSLDAFSNQFQMFQARSSSFFLYVIVSSVGSLCLSPLSFRFRL